MRRVVTGLVLIWTVGVCACQGVPPDEARSLSARSLEPAVSAWMNRGEDATPAALRSHRATTGSGDDAIGLKWTVEPPELQVYRATAVHLRVERFPEGHADATCSWSFGDGTPSQTGCRISHTYHGGQADQVVSLTLKHGDWTWNTSRPVRLERLSVVKGLLGDEAPKMDGIPSRPSGSGSKLRFAVISDGVSEAGTSSDASRAVAQLVSEVKPDLVFHLGGIATPKGGYGPTVEGVRGPLEAASIPWLPALSPGDLKSEETLKAPELRFVDREDFPRKYSFTREGAFFLVIATGDDGVREEDIAWMRTQLASASVYEARYVFSPLPLHKFSDKHVGSLNKRFRLYELFLRARVTAMFSASYGVYFKGRYGALPVVSVGALVPPGGSLAGHDFSQPTSFAVVDQHKGIPVRIFGVQGPDFDRPLDEAMLPEAVEVYTR